MKLYDLFFKKSSEVQISYEIITGDEIRSGDILSLLGESVYVERKAVREDGTYVIINDEGLTHNIYPELSYYKEV